MNAIEYLRAKQKICDYESNNQCKGCPIYILMKEYHMEDMCCDDFDTKYPEVVITGVENWLDAHHYPTWIEWLEYLYHDFQGFKNTSTIHDWLYTEIPAEAAKRYNIPYRSEII